jgi:hypothetical protein
LILMAVSCSRFSIASTATSPGAHIVCMPISVCRPRTVTLFVPCPLLRCPHCFFVPTWIHITASLAMHLGTPLVLRQLWLYLSCPDGLDSLKILLNIVRLYAHSCKQIWLETYCCQMTHAWAVLDVWFELLPSATCSLAWPCLFTGKHDQECAIAKWHTSEP